MTQHTSFSTHKNRMKSNATTTSCRYAKAHCELEALTSPSSVHLAPLLLSSPLSPLPPALPVRLGVFPSTPLPVPPLNLAYDTYSLPPHLPENPGAFDKVYPFSFLSSFLLSLIYLLPALISRGIPGRNRMEWPASCVTSSSYF